MTHPDPAHRPNPHPTPQRDDCQGYLDSGCTVRCPEKATHGAYPPREESLVPSRGCEAHAREWVAAWQRQGWETAQVRPLQ